MLSRKSRLVSRGRREPRPRKLRESAGADHFPEPEDDERTDHGGDPRAQIEELVDRVPETKSGGQNTTIVERDRNP